LVELVSPTCRPRYFSSAQRSAATTPLFFVSSMTSCSKSVFAPFGGTCFTNVRPPLFQFGVAFRSSKIRFFDQDRIQKFAFNRLVLADVSDDSIDGHGHLFKREFDRTG
jgi:hypothetical protein